MKFTQLVNIQRRLIITMAFATLQGLVTANVSNLLSYPRRENPQLHQPIMAP